MKVKNKGRQLVQQFTIKKAYVNRWDNISIDDIVTSGYDLNKVSDEALERATWQQGMLNLDYMMVHSDFSKDSWKDRLCSQLKKSGIDDEKRIKKVCNKAVDNIFDYLSNMGWF